MSLLDRFKKPSSLQDRLQKPGARELEIIFTELEKTEQSCLDEAITLFEDLEKNAKSSQELVNFLLEDIIFCSLYVTFYESIFQTIRENPTMAVELITRFFDTQAEREKIISKQANEHFAYIANHGKCHGCSSCLHHNDVIDLISPYQKTDLTFFINLYVGMQTIQGTLEHVLYRHVPRHLDLIPALTESNILALRQYIMNYVGEQWSQ